LPHPIMTGNKPAQDDLSDRYNSYRDQGLSKTEAHKAAFAEVKNKINPPGPRYPPTDPMGMDQETDWS
jgi:hypothetical protein